MSKSDAVRNWWVWSLVALGCVTHTRLCARSRSPIRQNGGGVERWLNI